MLFSLTPWAESKVKAFTNKQPDNLAVTKALFAHSSQLAAASGLPVHLCTEVQQQGSTFGERLTSAIQEVFAQGYDQLIIMGSDCVDLTPADLSACAKTLQTKGAAIGPTPSGGAYLIGLHRKAFRPEAFKVLPWQTADLLIALEQHLQLCGDDRLALRSDANGATALQLALKNSGCSQQLRALLSRLLEQQSSRRCFTIPAGIVVFDVLPVRPSRAPPAIPVLAEAQLAA